jgi:hypothetical protein
MSSTRGRGLLLIAAAAVAVSGFIHFYLYFRGGYRGIAPEKVVGVTISRAFALNAIAAVLVAEALVLSLRYPRIVAPSCIAAAAFAGATLLAYGLTRTTGFLGFTDDQTSTEAIIAVIAEVVAFLSATVALREWRAGLRIARSGST